ncbi:unnamed protein product [Effrenium voratum]|uniref:Uncharacterized protein n=1 Tax=Effrenium voratum TaxID=2562239 RepID=A0AA36ITB3_9DINO|nr:unnamed protein product [Effrenium voratum]
MPGAYGVEAISPTQVQVNTEFGHEEDPATGLTVKFALHVTAADTTKSNAPVASMHQEIGFSLALLRPKGGFQMRLPCRAEMLRASRTLGQWFMDPLNCGRSLLAETPTLEELNISFDGLARPLRYIPFTGGDLEQDISNLFNHLVNIFNRIYQDRLPGAMARLATSDRGLNFVNTLLAHHMSPAQCMNAAEAEEAIAGMFPATFSDWPKVLDGQMHGYLDRIIEGVLRQNQTTAPEGWLQMPPLTIGALSDVHLKDLRLTGTSQISKLQLMQTDTAEKEMLGFDLEAACPNDQKPFPTLLEMTWGATLDVGSEVLVQVQMPCGSLQASLNVSVDTIDTADILVPPSIFCTLLTPFQTLAVTSLEAVKQGPGALYVTLGSAPKVDVVEEMCKLYPKLCVFGSRLGEHLAHPGNATDLLSFLHKAAVKHCDALQVVTGRRLQEEKTRDEKGIPYDEGFNALLWIASLLGSLALAAGVTYLVAWKAGHSVNTRRSSLALHVFVGSRPGRGFIFVVSFLMFISLCLRLIATQTLPYVSMEMAMVYKPSGREIDSQTLGVFTFWGDSAISS